MGERPNGLAVSYIHSGLPARPREGRLKSQEHPTAATGIPQTQTKPSKNLQFLRAGQPVPLQLALREMLDKKLVVFGKLNTSLQAATSLQLLLQTHSLEREGKLHVVLDAFNFEMQFLLDDFTQGKISFDELLAQRADMGGEDAEIPQYRHVLEHARDNKQKVKLHAGFLPWPYARAALQEGGLSKALRTAKTRGYIHPNEACEGSEAHYNFFESLITGRSQADPEVSDSFRQLFPAKQLRDASMAYQVQKLLGQAASADRFLLLCGRQHMAHGFGLPERLGELREQTCLVYAWQAFGRKSGE